MLIALFLMNVVLIAGRSVYLNIAPSWVYIVQVGLLVVAIAFAISERRRMNTASAPKERV
jgi:hypothetical protein